MWVVGFEWEKEVETEVEVEEVVVFVAERRGLPLVAQGIFFGGPFPTVPSPL